ncbi:hypothetical protein Tco_0009173 [Tanacetum coccineum]
MLAKVADQDFRPAKELSHPGWRRSPRPKTSSSKSPASLLAHYLMCGAALLYRFCHFGISLVCWALWLCGKGRATI